MCSSVHEEQATWGGGGQGATGPAAGMPVPWARAPALEGEPEFPDWDRPPDSSPRQCWRSG